jgi:TRAP-type C4-dicarboxylate transport system substrate-binding protein
MKLSRRHITVAAAGAIAAPALLRSGFARAAEVNLRIHHFLPPTTNAQTGVMQPWAQAVQEQSGGRIEAKIFPSMQLGGAPPQLFDQVRDGIVDLVWTVPGYTPGRFPNVEAFELPFIAGNAEATSQALAEYVEKFPDAEFKDVVPIAFWVHDPGHLHLTKAKVEKLEDLQGLKIRFPTRQANEALKALNVNTVGMPVPQVPEALSRGVIDGTLLPWETVPTLRLHEICKTHTHVSSSQAFYTTTLCLLMNRKRYEALPADLRRVIDANRGLAWSRTAGKATDAKTQSGIDAAKARGNTIVTLGAEEVARWRQRCEPVHEAWAKEMEKRNADGRAMLREARALLAKYAPR